MRSAAFKKLVVAASLAIVSTATWAPPIFRSVPHSAPHSIPHPQPHPTPFPESAPWRSPDTMPKPPGEHPIDSLLKEAGRPQGDTNPILDKARRAGAPEDVLQAVTAQTDQYAKPVGLECCQFRAPWKDAANYSQRRAEEVNFAAAMKSETLVKKNLQYLVISDSPHVNAVLTGDEGIPGLNRARTTSFESRASVEREIDHLASRATDEMIELYLLAKHEDGEVLLANGTRIASEDLREYARQRRVLLHFWGCETGLSEIAGVKQSFDVRPLVKAIAKVMRSEGVASRADYLNAIHDDTGLEFTFDVLAHNEEKRLVSAAVYEQTPGSPAKPEQRDAQVGTFELPSPKGYSPTPFSTPGGNLIAAAPPEVQASQSDTQEAGVAGGAAGTPKDGIGAGTLLAGIAGLAFVLYLVGVRRFDQIRAIFRR